VNSAKRAERAEGKNLAPSVVAIELGQARRVRELAPHPLSPLNSAKRAERVECGVFSVLHVRTDTSRWSRAAIDFQNQHAPERLWLRHKKNAQDKAYRWEGTCAPFGILATKSCGHGQLGERLR